MAFLDIDLDIQILFCTFLYPLDILTLRKTCKSLQSVTRHRAVWVEALRRVCLENTLFLPSFPILDMSNFELEQAATAPLRWIGLSTPSSPHDSTVKPTVTRIIGDPFGSRDTTRLILIPGGRYLVGFSPIGLGVWDLGYTSSADCKLIASVGLEGGSSSGDVHATPDGMGLVIILLRPAERCSVYEIYPQSETPELTKIACLELPRSRLPSCVSPGKMIWFPWYAMGVTFRVWDYRLNASVAFLALDNFGWNVNFKVVATETAIVTLQVRGIYIWAIPPLLPQPPNFDDNALIECPPKIRINYQDIYVSPPIWRVMSSWYFDSSKPFYFDKTSPCSPHPRVFQVIIKPDLSDATVHFMNIIPYDLPSRETAFQPMYREDSMIYGWSSSDHHAIYESALSRPTLHRSPSITNILLAGGRSRHPRGLRICPASGRSVHLDTGRDTDKIVVSDFLLHKRSR